MLFVQGEGRLPPAAKEEGSVNWIRKRKARKQGNGKPQSGREVVQPRPGFRGKADGWAELDRQTALPRRMLSQGMK